MGLVGFAEQGGGGGGRVVVSDDGSRSWTAPAGWSNPGSTGAMWVSVLSTWSQAWLAFGRGEHGVGLLAALFSGEEAVAGVGGDALGGVIVVA